MDSTESTLAIQFVHRLRLMVILSDTGRIDMHWEENVEEQQAALGDKLPHSSSDVHVFTLNNLNYTLQQLSDKDSVWH